MRQLFLLSFCVIFSSCDNSLDNNPNIPNTPNITNTPKINNYQAIR